MLCDYHALRSSNAKENTFHHVYTTPGDIIMPYEGQNCISEEFGVETISTGSNHHCVYQKYPKKFIPEMIENIKD